MHQLPARKDAAKRTRETRYRVGAAHVCRLFTSSLPHAKGETIRPSKCRSSGDDTAFVC